MRSFKRLQRNKGFFGLGFYWVFFLILNHDGLLPSLSLDSGQHLILTEEYQGLCCWASPSHTHRITQLARLPKPSPIITQRRGSKGRTQTRGDFLTLVPVLAQMQEAQTFPNPGVPWPKERWMRKIWPLPLLPWEAEPSRPFLWRWSLCESNCSLRRPQWNCPQWHSDPSHLPCPTIRLFSKAFTQRRSRMSRIKCWFQCYRFPSPPSPTPYWKPLACSL